MNPWLIPLNVGKRNFLAWETYPEGLYTFLKDFSGYNLPLLVSENGLCTDSDEARSDYIAEHLKIMEGNIWKLFDQEHSLFKINALSPFSPRRTVLHRH